MTIKITVSEGPKETPNTVTFSLNARKTLDGDLMIFDHNEIDIILMPQKNKIVAFAKDEISEEVYEAQDRFFKFLSSKGVVAYDSIQGGNVYSSMEAAILESKEVNQYDTTLLVINKFIEAEKPLMDFEKAWSEEEEKRLTDPGPKDSTEFDPEKYHRSRQGSIPPNAQAYGLNSVYKL